MRYEEENGEGEIFRQVGGFNPDISGGEDSELCFRISGWKIKQLDHKMATHDSKITPLLPNFGPVPCVPAWRMHLLLLPTRTTRVKSTNGNCSLRFFGVESFQSSQWV